MPRDPLLQGSTIRRFAYWLWRHIRPNRTINLKAERVGDRFVASYETKTGLKKGDTINVYWETE